nr:ROK family protein [uncultured Microbacterium sp.]
MVTVSPGTAAVPAPLDHPSPVLARFSIGLDVGGTKVRGVLIDAAGRIVAAARARTRWSAEGVLDTVADVAGSLLDQAAIDIDEVSSIGLGIPGVVDPTAGVVVHAVNLGIDRPLRLAAEVGARLGCAGRVHVENDVNAAALGVVHALGLHDRSAVVISAGTGLAAGIVIEGRLWRGASGVAGEIGHISIDADGPPCKCGQSGCLEQYASGSAIGRAMSDGGSVSMKRLFARAADGDAQALAAIDGLATGLAAAVRLVTLSVDPERVILMGGVANGGEPLLAAVRAALVEVSAPSPFLQSLRMHERIMLAPDLADLPARGAARLRP